MSIKLKGMTWSHPRGYDPMVACSSLYFEQTGVEIIWDKRSLQDFESFPVEELAGAYDLIVIDHPHVGQITAENCLTPLDVPDRAAAFQAMARHSVGQSFPSYYWHGRQWAFPIDAATQVQAYRQELMEKPVTNWVDLLSLAEEGKVLLPMRPPHSLMTFFTFAANLGTPCLTKGRGDIIDLEAGVAVYEKIATLVGRIDPACFDMDPIAVFERMAEEGSLAACAPYIYGYVNYAIPGFRSHLIHFADIPVLKEGGPVGSALGGTGIAVSAFTQAPEAAVDFAYWIASGKIQSTLYASSGGQAGHAEGWENEGANRAASNFYRDTRATLEGAWVRPRHNGYMTFQHAAAARLNDGLKSSEKAKSVVVDLNRLFAESFK